jgi:AraC family transcriptional regulator
MSATPATVTPLHRMSTDPAASPIRVGLYAVSAGVVEAPESSTHRLSLHVGQPVWASCGWGDRLQRGLRREGDIDLTPAGLAGVWEDESPATFLLMQLSPALIEAAAGDLGLDRRSIALEPAAELRDPPLEHLAWALKSELEAGQPNGRPYLEGLSLALAARLVSRCATSHPAPKPRPTLSLRQLRRVTDYVEAHLDDDLSLRRLAEVAGLGLSHFKALFRRSAGLPLHQYVIGRRVERARQLLARGDRPISLVVLEAGFAHQSHMARHLRRLLGVAPSELARRGRSTQRWRPNMLASGR